MNYHTNNPSNQIKNACRIFLLTRLFFKLIFSKYIFIVGFHASNLFKE